MKMKDLIEAIEELRAFHGDSELMELEVYVEYNYGDRCRTRALAVATNVDLVLPEETGYSETELCIPRDGGYKGSITDGVCVVIGKGE